MALTALAKRARWLRGDRSLHVALALGAARDAAGTVRREAGPMAPIGWRWGRARWRWRCRGAGRGRWPGSAP
ncbi:MAG: hypothetical protein IPN17_32865 [Deltaproteobacteria bacterium]|nr:hypothetical protein [Deltaproteobacteria bacterium]